MFSLSNDRLFCYEETYRNPSQRLGCQCELFIVCSYFDLVFTSTLTDSLNTVLVTLSKPVHPRQKHTQICMCLWWRWGDSNSRPEYFSYTKFTIITAHIIVYKFFHGKLHRLVFVFLSTLYTPVGVLHTLVDFVVSQKVVVQ